MIVSINVVLGATNPLRTGIIKQGEHNQRTDSPAINNANELDLVVIVVILHACGCTNINFFRCSQNTPTDTHH